ncbi:MAG: hypothetical protein M3174_07470 [Actinomycetota bacterium]|nr:hypothetical protein [Actinomycetota bacterium]
MRRLLSLRAASLFALLGLLSAVLPAHATPVCDDEPRALCGGRIFPEPDDSVDFVQHNDDEYPAGILALEEEHPKFVKVSTLADLLNDEDAKSVNGFDIWVVEITNFNVPERRKIPVVASLSAHGTERAGLEGGVRYMEDLANWASNDPDHKLRNGRQKDSVGIPVRRVLRKVHVYFASINPDGWEDGDNENGNVYTRGNGNGVDLNREFPTMGWTETEYSPLSEPESKAWHRFMKRIDPVAATDIHGQITSPNNSFADIMYPAGEWNPREQAQEERFARHMKSNIARYFDKDGVELGDISKNVGAMQPAEYATGYDVVGYDDSGFMGDYFTQKYKALELDVENFASHIFPSGNWLQPLEKAHVAAVRGQLETLIVEALVYKKVNVSFRLGKTGYLFDPKRVTSKDGYGGPPPPKGYDPKPYNVSRMKYFRDLSDFAKRPLKRVLSASVKKNGLDGLKTLVITQRPYPRDPKGRRIGRGATTRALKKWVKKGGNLVLTDKGVKLLLNLGIVEKSAIQKVLSEAGHVDIEDRQDPYVKGTHTTASQTYYEVPLGYPAEPASAPHWTVDRAAWESAGGKTVGYVDEEDRVGLGRIEVGKGTVAIFGAILPKQTEKHDHFYGLADYGVTVAGGQILNNVIKYGRKGSRTANPES